MTETGPIRPSVHIAGPTAVGKSAVAVALAQRLGGEILTVDSMQVYRGLDIGTAKPTSERSLVPHHLIDLVGPEAGFDTVRWLDAAHQAEADVRRRGRLPIFCGGTGLYFRALLEGLDPLPASDPHLRQELEATPLAELLAELERLDPGTFGRIDRQNPRRVVRAVEILRLGGPMVPTPSPAQRTRPGSTEPIFVLTRGPEDLRRRMDARVEAMVAEGLVEETRRLMEHGLAGNRTAMQAIGYRQVAEYLHGERDLAATVALIKTKTWQFGKRQMTWFRKRTGVVWMEIGESEPPATTADRIVNHPGFGTSGN